MDLQQPLILVGAGRSGSTLFTSLLNAHPSIQFKGETSFLLARLWREVWGDRFWLNWPRHLAIHPTSAATPLEPMAPDEFARERQRVAALIADCMADLLGVTTDGGYWGFKEIWNGSAAFRYDWTGYHQVFPRAHWIHLIRDPFTFSRSCAQWNGTTLTRAYLLARLNDWVAMLGYNRRPASSGRFVEIRFEDLVHAPGATLEPLLSALGLAWEPSMTMAARHRVMTSVTAKHPADRILNPPEISALIAEIPGLNTAMAELGYALPTRLELADSELAASWIDLRDPEGETREWFSPSQSQPLCTTEQNAEHARLKARVSTLEAQLAALEHDPARVLGTRILERPWLGRLLSRWHGIND